MSRVGAARGVRFAPSPTGLLHVGNLRTAWISAQLARLLGEPWIIRFEDIDRPRVAHGAQAAQTADLAALGLHADQTILQSTRWPRHRELFTQALASGAIYACDCSRSVVQADLTAMASAPHAPVPAYSGRCRPALVASGVVSVRPVGAAVGWRFRTPDPSGRDDFLIGRGEGDDFTPSYHWACAIDDFDGRYRLLTRAWDLAPAAQFQRLIQTWLAQSGDDESNRLPPALYHTALVTTDDGQRLEKRTAGVTRAELLERGFDGKALLAAFQRSWPPLALAEAVALTEPGAFGGETARALALGQLLRGPVAQRA